MTFATISELLAAGVGGEKVREYVAEVTSGVGGVLTLKERADAAILAVANDRGTCPTSRADKLRTVTALGYMEREHDHLLGLLRVAYEREVPDLEQSDDSFQLWCEHLALDLSRKDKS